ncbi:MAG: TldD/PmbA family protein [Spirochaetes bacterium]|nr:MAG: TldD/PmbA family protein [Spirochaetota bacterium]
MENVKDSQFLNLIEKELITVIKILSSSFDYISILGSDITGFKYEYSGQSSSLTESMWADRGFVARIYKFGKVLEYSFNNIQPGDAETVSKKIIQFSENALINNFHIYPVPEEEPQSFSHNENVEIDPSEIDPETVFSELKNIFKETMDSGKSVFNARVVFEWSKVSKIFLSSKKKLKQNYIWSQSYLIPMVKKDDMVKVIYAAESGLKGMELLRDLRNQIKATVKDGESLLNAQSVVPGEYEVICTPDITGLIAHEAFGHGVEMDMFVKNRALGKDYIGKQVASPLVNMRDGAIPERHAGSFHFDDEGTAAGNTLIIENGILKRGISDLHSAFSQKTKPTGNGRRQSYKNKTYTRMTNTYFEPGNDNLESMLASVKHGYLLDYTQSGMEDPKNWGLQAIAILGKEIKNGKFTGKIISPVIMTGYVPDILKNTTMIGDKLELSGSGYCGKGWKEFVKVSSGGPYIKTRIRLG